MENLARYIIRASFSQERMQYLDQEGKVVYTAKDGKDTKVFPALEWLANRCSHTPNRGEQMVRYYGRHRKFTPRRLPITSWMIFLNYPYMMIISIETLSIPGTITSNHDAA